MNFLADTELFHFLRPAFLWLILPAAVACWALARIVFAGGGLQKLIDPDLLPHLLMRGGEKRPWLFTLIFALLTTAIIALAGPTWRKLPTPVYSNQDALVILLDLSPSMMATDLTPNRMTRARLKVLDILKQRKDGLTALVAYAGEAHIVTPLTDDTATIANLVPSLSPRIMPVPGSNIEMAVEEGLRLIKDGANGSGRLLAVTDGIAKAATSTIKSDVNSTDATLSILAVGSGEGSPIPKNTGSGFITDDGGSIIIANFDRQELARLAKSTGGHFSQITVDDSDIARVLPDNTTPEQAELTEREFDQWYEEGPWLVLLLLPFTLLLFRKGALACALPLALSSLIVASPSTEASQGPEPAEPTTSTTGSSLWQTPNQQGRDLLQQGDPKSAAQVFENSQWQGTAQYRAGEYGPAAENFSQSHSPQGLYNLGNSLTRLGRFDEAIKAYDEALAQDPALADAEHNREVAKKLKELQQQQQQSQQSDQEQNDQQQDQQSEQNAQQDQQQQDQGDQSEQQQNAQQDSQDQQQSEQESQNQQDQSESDQEDQQEQQAQGEQEAQQGEEQEQQANAQPQESDSPLDPETQQALDQWLRQIPDDPAGLMREKFKYESLQRRRAYRAGEWQPPENGATQRW
ncbi:VWA domain-containing protein [uncultured Microbulbifer sp.]|uniref:vWA domain-containing protein n=1 Tax=uncultured Microbulbifer sp. TaxID=348147 RepID=UPI002631F922|nr:VWA domain-containing protein [uncultured Microbulbifer sp.]